MKTTDIYPDDTYQMRHCDPCGMPEAIVAVADNTALYSAIKHTIMATRADWDNQKSLDHMRKVSEEQGTLPIFEQALKCIRCAEGLTLIIGGRDKPWRVGGDRAVG